MMCLMIKEFKDKIQDLKEKGVCAKGYENVSHLKCEGKQSKLNQVRISSVLPVLFWGMFL